MKRTSKITFSAMMVALASFFMLTSYFPYLTYSIPAIAGIFIMVSVIEIDKKWAVLSYFASAVIIFFLAEPEAKLLYIAFFGYYPIIKAAFENIKNRSLEYILKFAVFNAAVILSYTVLAGMFGVSFGEMDEFGKNTVWILLILANIVFPIYDIALSRVASFYMMRVHSTVRKILKI